MIDAIWGSNPRFGDGVSFRFIRSEGRSFPSHRCLIPASEFRMTVRARIYRVTLDGGHFFYLAGIWEPGTGDWPVCYRIVTVAANPEVARYQDRHGAIIHRHQVMQWLDHIVPAADLLETPTARTFIVDELARRSREPTLAL